VFCWPAAGIASGVLIALGPSARLPVAAGVLVATANPWQELGASGLNPVVVGKIAPFSLLNPAEVLIVAGFIQHYFGDSFTIGRLRHVLGLLMASITGAFVLAVGATIVFKLFSFPPAAPALILWEKWYGFAPAVDQSLPRWAQLWFPSQSFGRLSRALVLLGKLRLQSMTAFYAPRQSLWFYPLVPSFLLRCSRSGGRMRHTSLTQI
jgi:hypothetical protein